MRSENYLKAFFGLIGANRPRYGGYIVHVGIVLIAIGVVGSSFYNVNKEVTLKPGESASIKNYTITFDNWSSGEITGRQVASATLSVFGSGKFLGKMVPVIYYDKNWDMTATNVAILANPAEDLYIIPEVGWDKTSGSWDWDYSGDAASFKFIVNPLVDWIWVGGAVLLLGGLIALWPQVQRMPAQSNGEIEEHPRRVADKKRQIKEPMAKKSGISRAQGGGRK